MNEKLNIIGLKTEVVEVTPRRLECVVGDCGIIVFRRGKGKRRWFDVAVGWKQNGTIEIQKWRRLSRISDLAQHKSEVENETIRTLWDQIVSALEQITARWSDILLEKKLKNILIRDLLGSQTGGRDTPVGTMKWEPRKVKDIISLWEPIKKINLSKKLEEKLTLQDTFNIVSQIYGKELGELLEVIVSNALTLKLVMREQGYTMMRPNWLLIITPPSGLKSTMLKFLMKSPYVIDLGDISAASLLPADPEQQSVIEKIHGKVTLFPTLSRIAEKDPKEAGQILSILESVYDGKFRRDTAYGSRETIVDTVIIGALTDEVFEEKFLKPMIAYGSRWLIYRYSIEDKKALKIGEMLTNRLMERGYVALQETISKLFTIALEKLDRYDFDAVQFSNTQKSDLKKLAQLLAKLRVAYHRRRGQIEDPDTGKIIYVDEIEVTQTDIPIRSYLQLYNFVRANTLIRQVPEVLRMPRVDKHAMCLATKLAIGSTSSIISKIIKYLLKHHDESIGQNNIAEELKISRSTVRRNLAVLHKIDIITDTTCPRLSETYYKILKKYLK